MLVAAAQLSPVYLDRKATVDRAVAAMHDASARGARMIVFPEAFIPGYPMWVWTIPPGDTQALRSLYAELLRQAVSVPDETTERLCRAARDAQILVVIGVNERNREASNTSIFNSLLFIDAQGRLLGKRRKLVPTSGERLVHAMGDGSTFDVYDTPLGRLGGLICWENYMPLARHAMYCLGLELLATPTWDRGEPWVSTLRHVAKEGRVYVIGCGNAIRIEDVPDRLAFKSLLEPDDEGWVNPGDSAIVDPDGKFVTGPCHGMQEIIYGEIDPEKITGPRWQLDVGGHYARPDVFRMQMNRAAAAQLEMCDESPAGAAPITPARASAPARSAEASPWRPPESPSGSGSSSAP
jgi:nitrilase